MAASLALALGFELLVLLTPAQSRAQRAPAAGDDGACTAVLTGALDPELVARIRGQSGDVPCTLVVRPGREPASLPHQGADATVAIRGELGGGYSVQVRELESGVTHTRAIDAPAVSEDAAARDPLARSAAFEAIALVVRSELLELSRAVAARLRALRERTTASATQQSTRVRGPAPGASARELDADERAAAGAASDEERLLRAEDAAHGGKSAERDAWSLLLGYELSDVGVSAPAHALAARASLELGALALGVGGTYAASAPLTDSAARALVQRHSLAAFVGYSALRSRALRVLVGGSAGIVLTERRTRVRDASLVATSDASTVSALLGVEAALELTLAAPLSLRLSAGLDAVPSAPRYAYEEAGVSVERAAPRYLQPRAGLGVALRFF